MRKMIPITAAFLVAGLATAGLDTYTGKNFTTCLTPTAVNAAPVTNSAVTGTDIASLPGKGALLLSYRCDNAAAAVLSFSIGTCSTTNGTYAAYTNASGVSAWAFTNASGVAVLPFTPNSVSRYMRVTVTPTAVTNGNAAAVLVTE